MSVAIYKPNLQILLLQEPAFAHNSHHHLHALGYPLKKKQNITIMENVCFSRVISNAVYKVCSKNLQFKFTPNVKKNAYSGSTTRWL